MVSDSLVEFIEKRYDHFKPTSLEELQKFLDEEKYLTDSARTKAFAIFETRIGDFGEVGAPPKFEVEVVEELQYGKTPWSFTGKEHGKIATKTTWKYIHELYDRNDIQWVMLRDKKTGQFKERV